MSTALTFKPLPSMWDLPDTPRERILSGGAGGLSAAQLFGICLGSGMVGENAASMSQRLISHFGSFSALLAASPERLLAQRGVGMARAALIAAIHELHCREDETELAQSQVLQDVGNVARYIQRRIGHSPREVFGALFLDTRHRPILWQSLFFGSLNKAHVSSREILKRALEVNAAALVIAHNHPSGVAEPSAADLHLTLELKDLLARIDVALLDHIIVAPGTYVSLAARGLINGSV